jgi:hypothetical protein
MRQKSMARDNRLPLIFISDILLNLKIIKKRKYRDDIAEIIDSRYEKQQRRRHNGMMKKPAAETVKDFVFSRNIVHIRR